MSIIVVVVVNVIIVVVIVEIVVGVYVCLLLITAAVLGVDKVDYCSNEDKTKRNPDRYSDNLENAQE